MHKSKLLCRLHGATQPNEYNKMMGTCVRVNASRFLHFDRVRHPWDDLLVDAARYNAPADQSPGTNFLAKEKTFRRFSLPSCPFFST